MFLLWLLETNTNCFNSFMRGEQIWNKVKNIEKTIKNIRVCVRITHCYNLQTHTYTHARTRAHALSSVTIPNIKYRIYFNCNFLFISVYVCVCVCTFSNAYYPRYFPRFSMFYSVFAFACMCMYAWEKIVKKICKCTILHYCILYNKYCIIWYISYVFI